MTKSKLLPLPSYIGNTYLTSISCFCFLTRRSGALGLFVYICIPDLSGDFRRSSRSNTSLIFSRPLASCNAMFYWTFPDSRANGIQASKPAMAKRQYCRYAREPYVTKMSLCLPKGKYVFLAHEQNILVHCSHHRKQNQSDTVSIFNFLLKLICTTTSNWNVVSKYTIKL